MLWYENPEKMLAGEVTYVRIYMHDPEVREEVIRKLPGQTDASKRGEE